MKDAPFPIGTPREWAIDLAVITFIGVFLGIIGPFGSFYGGGVAARLAYWVADMWIGFVIISLSSRLSVVVGSRLDLPDWFALALGVVVGALPLTLALGAFSAAFWPPEHFRPSPPLLFYGQVLVISEPFAFGFYYLSWRVRGAGPSPVAPADAASRGPAVFLDRMPPRLGRDLLCLQMEDHYVRAHTAQGSDLILTPLKDAIAALGGLEGLRVHRSWWVARGAVRGSAISGRNISLKLTNGLDVPVSRASVARLRAAGWLGPN